VHTTWERSKEKRLHYVRRRAEETPLYRVIFHYRDEFERRWEELFQERYGALRREVLDAFDSYLNCGILLHGCARAYCKKCKHSELIAFSCKRRGLCPSCDAKRALIFAEHLHENVLKPHPHRHLVFSIPKRLRVYFKYDRALTKLLYRAAWEAWSELVSELCPEGKTGAVMALHTAGDLLHFHPHIHAIALNGVIDQAGHFHELASIDTAKLESLFQKKILQALVHKKLITEDIVTNMLSWEHSGFHVFAGERILPEDADLRRFLARYLKKAPLALERMEIVENGQEPKIVITRKRDDGDDSRVFSPLEFLAELSAHIPDIWEQTTRYYGIYAARTRGAQKRVVERNAGPELGEPDKPPVSKQWAIWIRKIYEVDPLLCPRCGEQMKIIAFIHDSREISRITEHLGILPWRAPPALRSQHRCEPAFVPLFD
jgi:hypothetical protein